MAFPGIFSSAFKTPATLPQMANCQKQPHEAEILIPSTESTKHSSTVSHRNDKKTAAFRMVSENGRCISAEF